jgi:hypothetical protein
VNPNGVGVRGRHCAFSTEHRRCGYLDGGLDEATVLLACECGAAIDRRADEGDALDVNG